MNKDVAEPSFEDATPQPPAADGLPAWTAPTILRMRAGSAEATPGPQLGDFSLVIS